MKKALLALLICGCSHLQAQDWPQWRGPHHDNISTERNWSPQKLTDNDAVVWSASVGKGHTSPVVAGGRLYTQGMEVSIDGSDTTYTEQVLALDVRNGKILWRHRTPVYSRRLTVTFGGPGATPLVHAGKVYTQGREGLFLCLNAADGKVIWQKNLLDDKLSPMPSWGFNASPMIHGDGLYLNVGEHGLALNKDTGAVIWKSASKSGGDATPMLFSRAGRSYLLLNTNSRLAVLNPDNGDVISETAGGSSVDPVWHGDELIFCKDGMQRLSWDGRAFQQKWRNAQVRGSFMTGVALNDAYYTMDSNRGRNFNLSCLDLETGKLFWQEKLGEHGSLMATPDWLIILTGLGEVILAKPDTQAFKPVYRRQVLTLPPRVGKDAMVYDYIWSYPLLSNGRLYCKGTNGELVCIDLN